MDLLVSVVLLSPFVFVVVFILVVTVVVVFVVFFVALSVDVFVVVFVSVDVVDFVNVSQVALASNVSPRQPFPSRCPSGSCEPLR